MGSIADGARVDRPADGQEFREHVGRSCERRERCKLRGHIGKLRRDAAFKRQGGECLRSFASIGTLATDEAPNAQRNVAI